MLDTWQHLGVTGEGVRVGIIDTGIDYTHADFGGPGTVAGWDQAHADSAGPFTPTAKVVGGFDFAGDDYNADPDAADYQPDPDPDSNPLDCNGHGTHVAGTAAGYGVNTDGSTFTDDYAGLTGDDLYKMTVGPGMAPKASLYALKVFGCTGSTDLVIPALDWALDPDGNGDFTDHLDIVNLSLGSDYSPVDDPDNQFIDELAKNGVLPVIAAGNGGDLTDIGGRPGNAVRSLAVANSVDQSNCWTACRSTPRTTRHDRGRTGFGRPTSGRAQPDVSGDVVPISDPPNRTAAIRCPPTAVNCRRQGRLAGMGRRRRRPTLWFGGAGGHCPGGRRIGVAPHLGRWRSSRPVSTGSAVIPVFQLLKSATDALRPALDSGTLRPSPSPARCCPPSRRDPSIADTLSSVSSRGVHGSNGVVKPDVAAPGSTIASAGCGPGSGVVVESGRRWPPRTPPGSPHWSSRRIRAGARSRSRPRS